MTIFVQVFAPSSLHCLSSIGGSSLFTKGAARPGKCMLAGIRGVYMGENREGIKTSRVVDYKTGYKKNVGYRDTLLSLQ